MFFMALIPEDTPSANPMDQPAVEIAKTIQDQFQAQTSLLPGFSFNPSPFNRSPMEKDYLKNAGKSKKSHYKMK